MGQTQHCRIRRFRFSITFKILFKKNVSSSLAANKATNPRCSDDESFGIYCAAPISSYSTIRFCKTVFLRNVPILVKKQPHMKARHMAGLSIDVLYSPCRYFDLHFYLLEKNIFLHRNDFIGSSDYEEFLFLLLNLLRYKFYIQIKSNIYISMSKK